MENENVVSTEPEERIWDEDDEARVRAEFEEKFPDFKQRLFEAIDRLANTPGKPNDNGLTCKLDQDDKSGERSADDFKDLPSQLASLDQDDPRFNSMCKLLQVHNTLNLHIADFVDGVVDDDLSRIPQHGQRCRKELGNLEVAIENVLVEQSRRQPDGSVDSQRIASRVPVLEPSELKQRIHSVLDRLAKPAGEAQGWRRLDELPRVSELLRWVVEGWSYYSPEQKSDLRRTLEELYEASEQFAGDSAVCESRKTVGEYLSFRRSSEDVLSGTAEDNRIVMFADVYR